MLLVPPLLHYEFRSLARLLGLNFMKFSVRASADKNISGKCIPFLGFNSTFKPFLVNILGRCLTLTIPAIKNMFRVKITLF
jgi:hypothetical protein